MVESKKSPETHPRWTIGTCCCLTRFYTLWKEQQACPLKIRRTPSQKGNFIVFQASIFQVLTRWFFGSFLLLSFGCNVFLDQQIAVETPYNEVTIRRVLNLVHFLGKAGTSRCENLQSSPTRLNFVSEPTISTGETTVSDLTVMWFHMDQVAVFGAHGYTMTGQPAVSRTYTRQKQGIE